MSEYDSSWDADNEELWGEKYEQWQERAWLAWLKDNLTFPFEVSREEDMNENPFIQSPDKPFAVGHVFKILGLDMEDDMYGVICKAREGRKIGYVPLSDVEVTSESDPNYWPVREYVVWFANQ